MSIKHKNWSISTDNKGYCWLTLDRQDASTNTLGRAVLTEFDEILSDLTNTPPKALIIRSAKSNGFIAGADISEFLNLPNAETATATVRKTQQIYDKLAALPCPTVAMIKGFCLGGGLELALACKYRVAEDHPKTKIGLPEVSLGVQPGWGGSVRLPRLIGSLKALELIVAGKIVDARSAAKLGIIDAAVPERQLEIAVQHYASGAEPVRHAGKLEKFIQFAPIRYIVGKFFTWQINKKANRIHYPAPYAVVDTWVANSIYSDHAMQAEAESIGKLMVTDTARNLVRIFFLRDRLKSMAKSSNFQVKHVHVIGAGVMGGDIAAWCALNGLTVTVQDQSLKAISATLGRAATLFEKKLKIQYLINAAKDRLMPDVDGFGISKADVIIEAIIENVEAKQNLFVTLEQQAKPNAILATNTSTIPLGVIAKRLNNPRRVVGIHYFNPVSLMPLVEVVTDTDTDKQVVDNALSFVAKIDKLPLVVKSSPGFLVNRVLIPYLLESAAVYEEGVPGPVIDKAITDFGMMMGPIELMDAVGLDICVAAGKSMGAPLPEFISRMVAEGKLGKKSGEGFYKYVKGKVVKPKVALNANVPSDISDRIMLRMINEAAACLREGIVTDADLVDAGLIFGAGFAPFLGGPIHYIDACTKAQIKERMLKLVSKYGTRFNPDQSFG